jgi:hypothetical protein
MSELPPKLAVPWPTSYDGVSANATVQTHQSGIKPSTQFDGCSLGTGLFKWHYSDRAIVSGMAAMPDFH